MAAAAGEEGTEEESQKVVCGRGEDGWGIYRVWHAECCMQLSLAQFVSFRESSSSRRACHSPLGKGGGEGGGGGSCR